jgi:hypothetical protein
MLRFKRGPPNDHRFEPVFTGASRTGLALPLIGTDRAQHGDRSRQVDRGRTPYARSERPASWIFINQVSGRVDHTRHLNYQVRAECSPPSNRSGLERLPTLLHYTWRWRVPARMSPNGQFRPFPWRNKFLRSSHSALHDSLSLLRCPPLARELLTCRRSLLVTAIVSSSDETLRVENASSHFAHCPPRSDVDRRPCSSPHHRMNGALLRTQFGA